MNDPHINPPDEPYRPDDADLAHEMADEPDEPEDEWFTETEGS